MVSFSLKPRYESRSSSLYRPRNHVISVRELIMPQNCIKITFKNGKMTIYPSKYMIHLRRDTKERMSQVVFAQDEFIYTTDTLEYFRGDGVTPGGIFFAKE